MGEAARRRAVAEFADEVVTARMVSVYGEPAEGPLSAVAGGWSGTA